MTKARDIADTKFPTADINGGTIDGTVIGATTPGAISGTTGQFSTGLNVDGLSYLSGMQVRDSLNAPRGYVQGDADGLLLATDGARNITFDTNAAERMRIDSSGNVGIGTSSLSGANVLHLYGGNSTGLLVETTSTVSRLAFKDVNTTDANTVRIGSQTDDMTFIAGSAERLRIDSTGNVGIGTSSPDTLLQITKADDTLLNVLSNGSYSASFVSSTSGSAGDTTGIFLSGSSGINRGAAILAEVQSTGNDHDLIFATNAASAFPSEAMRIDSSGRVGIGTSSPSRKLTIEGIAGDNAPVRVQSGAGETSTFIDIKDPTTTGDFKVRIGCTGDSFVAYAGGSEAMRIDSAGNVGIGTTAPGSLLDVAGKITANQIKFASAIENGTVTAAAATGTVNFDVSTQSVLFYTLNATANWTVNIRGSSTETLDSLMEIGDSQTVAFLTTQGTTAFYNTAVTVDGVSVTPQWQGGAAPTAGNVSSTDIYNYTIIKTASATFSVFAAVTQFA